MRALVLTLEVWVFRFFAQESSHGKGEYILLRDKSELLPDVLVHVCVIFRQGGDELVIFLQGERGNLSSVLTRAQENKLTVWTSPGMVAEKRRV